MWKCWLFKISWNPLRQNILAISELGKACHDTTIQSYEKKLFTYKISSYFYFNSPLCIIILIDFQLIVFFVTVANWQRLHGLFCTYLNWRWCGIVGLEKKWVLCQVANETGKIAKTGMLSLWGDKWTSEINVSRQQIFSGG